MRRLISGDVKLLDCIPIAGIGVNFLVQRLSVLRRGAADSREIIGPSDDDNVAKTLRRFVSKVYPKRRSDTPSSCPCFLLSTYHRSEWYSERTCQIPASSSSRSAARIAASRLESRAAGASGAVARLDALMNSASHSLVV